ncbi:MAG: NUDIX hydrolase [Myxococcales bacterium]|nr:NUDIX hydrolase [Myxococcales bacterium]
MSRTDDADFITRYQAEADRWPRPAVTVDLVVFTVRDGALHLLLVRRREPPFAETWALPGGFVRVGDGVVDQGEDLDAAAARELAEETGLSPGDVRLEQLYTFGAAGRDPRMRVISVAWYALVRPELAPTAGGDAAEAAWHPVTARPPLAFDHDRIVDTALARLRGKLDYSPIAFDLVPATFTVAELHAVHDAIRAEPQDAANFRRRFRRLEEDGLVAPVGQRPTGKRPATLYRFTSR